jgi:hypothetical protein
MRLFGNIAHVWVHMKQIGEKWTSSKRINSIQLFFDKENGTLR